MRKIQLRKPKGTGKRLLSFKCLNCGTIQKTDKYTEIVHGEFMSNCISCGETMLHQKRAKTPKIAVIWFAWKPDFEGF